MTKTFTTETRIRLTNELRDYLNSYTLMYSELYRIVWHNVAAEDFKQKHPKVSNYITYICNKYGVLKRTVNTIYRSVVGRQRALLELKKQELRICEQKKVKISSAIEILKAKINTLKPKVRDNLATQEELIKYRELKHKLYQKQRRYNRYSQKVTNLSNVIKFKKYSICFGSKRLYKAQWYLTQNGYKSKVKWLNTFRNFRDKNIEYLGSNDETCGNQMCQLTYNIITDDFTLKIRKENVYSNPDKYIYIDNLNFKYLRDELINICSNYNEALTFRFKKVNNRWYLQVIFAIEKLAKTRSSNGVWGLDFNSGFIEATETDKAGNIVNQRHFDLKYHGCGNKAKSEMAETISKIVNIALSTGRDIAIEDLSFVKKKSQVTKNKEYNKMLHTLDYARYITDIENACHRKEVGLLKVNPAYTSYIGEYKYGKARKLNRHQAASYVIARLGQGYTDSYNNKTTYVS